MRSFVNGLILFCFLFGTWLILSGIFSLGFLVIGAIASVLSIVITYHLGMLHTIPLHRFVTWRFGLYLIWLLKEIILSAVDVIKLVWHPGSEISPEIAWVSTKQQDDLARTVFANSITLTPGTVSVLVKEKHFAVHALLAPAMQSLHEGGMDTKVAEAM